MYEEIIEQLRDYCDCIPEMDDDVLAKNVEEMIWLISNITCWSNSPCETLLNSERVEYVDVAEFDPCSCGGITEFHPFYYSPIDPNSFEVFLIKIDGVNEESERISSNYYGYSESKGILRIDVRPYVQIGNCGGCNPEYRLQIRYNAGYEKLPECLLQLFCDLLHTIYTKNNCDCSSCQACKLSTNEGEFDFAPDDEVSPKLKNYLNILIESAYRRQLGLLSLCHRKSFNKWGFVV